MSGNSAREQSRGGQGTVTGRQWQRRRIRPTVLALESRTLLSNLYVNSANSGPADGLTPATGFTTIQAGISSAGTGDTILVETGNGYNESDTVGVNGLTIEADAGQAPILDGTNSFPQTSPGFTIASTGVTIAGFVIQNFSGPSAIVVQGGGSLALSSDVLQDNSASAGGAVFNSGGASIAVDDCTFAGNRASEFGGAIDSDGHIDLLDSGFTSNSASGTGGALLDSGGGSSSISGCSFSGNRAGIVGGGISVSSGALTIANTTFAGNTSGDPAGGLFSRRLCHCDQLRVYQQHRRRSRRWD